MRARSPCRFLVAALVFWIGLSAAADPVGAEPKICGNQPALGGWSLANCPGLRDDDGDGIYSVTLSLADTALLEYKILPTGMWDGLEVRAQGTCPADGGSKRNDTQNIQISQPDTRGPVTFYFDGRSLTDPSYSPVTGNRSGGDSLMLKAPASACPRWIAIGDFQNLYGDNSSAAPLVPLRPGVWAGRVTASKSLAAGWRWKVLEQSAAVAREYGPTGWAYAPCEAAFATVTSPVSVGDTVYFLLHERGGRMQTLVSSAPLDGFSSDGSPGCEPAADLGGDPRDLASGGPSDAGSGPGPADGAADGGPLRRPGIHCDCQVGAATGGPVNSAGSLALSCLASLGALLSRAWMRRDQRRQIRRKKAVALQSPSACVIA